jgi:hypothetical protein
MLLRAATLLFAILLPFSVAAQRMAPATLADTQRPLFDRLLSIEVSSGAAGTTDQVVPLWASPDGRLMAIVALSRGAGAPTLPPSPAFGGVSDLRIVDATDLFSAGLRLRLGDGLRADMMLGQESASAVPFDFPGSPGCVNCLGEIDAARASGVLSAAIGLGWTAPNGVDLSFGLSWLDGRHSQLPVLADGGFAGGPIDLALMDVPEVASYKLNSGRRLSARGTWQLDQGPVIDLTAALTRADLMPIWYGLPGTGLDLNQATLGLGVHSGSLRGSIVGRISSLDEPGVLGSKRWSGLDLGVSWRTPWRGEVTVGAQNLFSAPLDAAAARDMDATQARMPYVQYRQDL